MNDERRIYPRISVDIAAEVELHRIETVDVRITDLSLSGLSIEGDERLTNLRPIASYGPMELEVHFGIEGSPVHCRCRVIYKRREGQSKSSMGLTILTIPEDQKERLATFIGRAQS